jgi:hypothetical protein
MARNGKRIGDVDLSRHDDLYLFNHFAGEDKALVRELWDYLADWYVKETGLRNSMGLVPMDDSQSDYAIVNWASWDDSLLGHFARSVGKPSFWKYVKGNLDANMAVSMPVYCRLA